MLTLEQIQEYKAFRRAKMDGHLVFRTPGWLDPKIDYVAMIIDHYVELRKKASPK
mgnify:CR=1 FL=1